MDRTSRKFLFDLLGTPSPVGFEAPGQRVWKRFASRYADSVENDAYGTTWATLDGKGRSPKTVMLEAHADEIGYMVKQISSDGFLRLDRIGGSDTATARGKRVDVLGDNGPVRGVIGNTAIHIRDRTGGEKAPEIHELYVDVGASSAEDVAKMGIRVGHPMVYTDSVEEFGDGRLIGRALDNRIGGYIIAQVIAKLAKAKTRPSAKVHAVNAVQEEIGGYGAKMAAHRLAPDVCIVLDVTHATDSPGIDITKHGDVKLGGGPGLTHGTANHPEVVERLMAVAEKKKIPIQHEASSRYTGTDTDSIYHVGSGIPSALVSLPQRYMHSAVEMVDLKDVSNVIDLLAGFVQSVRATDNFTVRL